MGRIADKAKSNIPTTWDMLSKDARIGDTALLEREIYIENLIFASTQDDTAEDAMHELVAEYAGKCLAVECIQLAIDHTQHVSEMESTQQPVELTRFPERLKHLKEAKADLLADIARLEPIVAPLIPNINTRRSASAPRLSSIDDDLLTPNPQDFGPIYAPLET
jgi:hypothetical protein